MRHAVLDSGVGIITNGLVAWFDAAQTRSYSGSGTTWTDLSGNGNTGTTNGSPSYTTDNGGIFTFDGIDDYVNITNNVGLNTDYSTQEIWLQPTNPTDGVGYQFFTRGNTSPGTFNLIKNSANQFQFNVRRQDNVQTSLVLATAPSTNWVQFVGTFDGTSQIAYINGVQDASVAFSGTINTGGTFLLNIGRNTAGTSYGKAKIAIARVYNRALSSTEILQNYNAEKSRFGL